jgi:hypothetical protein
VISLAGSGFIRGRVGFFESDEAVVDSFCVEDVFDFFAKFSLVSVGLASEDLLEVKALSASCCSRVSGVEVLGLLI